MSLPQLVLLPGLDGTGKFFRTFREEWDGRSIVISYPTDQCLGYAALTALVASRLPKEPFALLGESFSGPIAIRIAANPPPLLQALILCGTFGRNPYPWLGWAKPLAPWLPVKSLPRWIRAPLMWGSQSLARAPRQAQRAIAAVDTAVVRARIAALLSADETLSLNQVRVPTLVISGCRDRVVPRNATRWLLEHVPHARHALIDGPHLLLQACAEQCAGAIDAFLKEIGPQRGPIVRTDASAKK